MQMNLLNAHITQVAQQNPNVVVTGGYLCYGMNTVQFVPIGDVIAEYNTLVNQGITQKPAINRNMSATFLARGEGYYNIQNLLTYGST